MKLALLSCAAAALSSTAQPQHRFTAVRTMHQPAPNSVIHAAGDLDGDGDPDLVTGGLSWLENDDTSWRVPPTGKIASMSTSSSVAVFDADGDGDLDLFAPLRLFVNQGNGQFVDRSGTHLPQTGPGWSVGAVLAADFEGDGDQDLMLFFTASRTEVWANDGTGRFAVGRSFQQMFAPAGAGDVDGDGDIDVVNRAGPWLNSGRLRFELKFWPPGPCGPRDLELGDLDGDGDLDAFGADLAGGCVWTNDGRGQFSLRTVRLEGLRGNTGIALADLGGTGIPDVILEGTSGAWVLTPDATGYRVSKVLTRSSTWSAVATDVDGDGRDDVLVSTPSSIELHFGDGQGQTADATGADLASIGRLADLDGDGDLDSIGMISGEGRVALNDGTGRLVGQPSDRLPTGRIEQLLALGDVDGDGDIDLVATDRVSGRLYRNDGSARFSRDHIIPMQAGRTFGDIDGDSDLDVVGVAKAWLNDGTGRFPATLRLPNAVRNPWAACVADVDLDGDLDVLYTGFPVQLILNNGPRGFADVSATHLPAQVEGSVELADLDNDGDLDIVVFIDHARHLWLNAGSGRFADASSKLAPFTATTATMKALDCDMDGDTDLLFHGAPHFSLQLNDGLANFVDASAEVSNIPWFGNRIVDAGDLDRDGDPDIVIGHETVWRNRTRQVRIDKLASSPGTLTLRVEMFGLSRPANALPLFSPFSHPSNGLPLPPFGVLMLDPRFVFAGAPSVVPLPSGVATSTIAVPPLSMPATVFAQWLLVDAAGVTTLSGVLRTTTRR